MAKDHGPSIKNDKQYEGLRRKGMSMERAARIAKSPGSSAGAWEKGMLSRLGGRALAGGPQR